MTSNNSRTADFSLHAPRKPDSRIKVECKEDVLEAVRGEDTSTQQNGHEGSESGNWGNADEDMFTESDGGDRTSHRSVSAYASQTSPKVSSLLKGVANSWLRPIRDAFRSKTSQDEHEPSEPQANEGDVAENNQESESQDYLQNVEPPHTSESRGHGGELGQAKHSEPHSPESEAVQIPRFHTPTQPRQRAFDPRSVRPFSALSHEYPNPSADNSPAGSPATPDPDLHNRQPGRPLHHSLSAALHPDSQPQPAPLSTTALGQSLAVKLQLMPALTLLQHLPKCSVATGAAAATAQSAAQIAQTALEEASNMSASAALRGRCSFYLGIATMALAGLDPGPRNRGQGRSHAARPLGHFERALEAEGTFPEGEWARKWIRIAKQLDKQPSTAKRAAVRTVHSRAETGDKRAEVALDREWRESGDEGDAGERGIAVEHKMPADRNYQGQTIAEIETWWDSLHSETLDDDEDAEEAVDTTDPNSPTSTPTRARPHASPGNDAPIEDITARGDATPRGDATSRGDDNPIEDASPRQRTLQGDLSPSEPITTSSWDLEAPVPDDFEIPSGADSPPKREPISPSTVKRLKNELAQGPRDELSAQNLSTHLRELQGRPPSTTENTNYIPSETTSELYEASVSAHDPLDGRLPKTHKAASASTLTRPEAEEPPAKDSDRPRRNAVAEGAGIKASDLPAPRTEEDSAIEERPHAKSSDVLERVTTSDRIDDGLAAPSAGEEAPAEEEEDRCKSGSEPQQSAIVRDRDVVADDPKSPSTGVIPRAEDIEENQRAIDSQTLPKSTVAERTDNSDHRTTSTQVGSSTRGDSITIDSESLQQSSFVDETKSNVDLPPSSTEHAPEPEAEGTEEQDGYAADPRKPLSESIRDETRDNGAFSAPTTVVEKTYLAESAGENLHASRQTEPNAITERADADARPTMSPDEGSAIEEGQRAEDPTAQQLNTKTKETAGNGGLMASRHAIVPTEQKFKAIASGGLRKSKHAPPQAEENVSAEKANNSSGLLASKHAALPAIPDVKGAASSSSLGESKHEPPQAEENVTSEQANSSSNLLASKHATLPTDQKVKGTASGGSLLQSKHAPPQAEESVIAGSPHSSSGLLGSKHAPLPTNPKDIKADEGVDQHASKDLEGPQHQGRTRRKRKSKKKGERDAG